MTASAQLTSPTTQAKPNRKPIRFRVRVPQDIAGVLDRYVTAIVADLRRRFEDRGKTDQPTVHARSSWI